MCTGLQVLVHFLTSFKAYNAALMEGTSREETGDQLAYAMKLIIIPLLSRSFELRQHEVVGEAAVQSMVKDMFDPIEEVQGMLPCACLALCARTLGSGCVKPMIAKRKVKDMFDPLKEVQGMLPFAAIIRTCSLAFCACTLALVFAHASVTIVASIVEDVCLPINQGQGMLSLAHFFVDLLSGHVHLLSVHVHCNAYVFRGLVYLHMFMYMHSTPTQCITTAAAAGSSLFTHPHGFGS